VKSGYPPLSLRVVPELPLSSLGLKQGDQIMVALKEECPSKPAATTPAAPPSYYSSTTKSSSPPTSRLAAPARVPKIGPDSVDVDGSVLVHQVHLLTLFANSVALVM
jgi:ubiquitin thioesterase OTU1